MKFHNKTVIITGASVGIGKATAIEFARNGALLYGKIRRIRRICILDLLFS